MKNAQVTVEGTVVGAIGMGLLVFLGVTHSDTQEEADYLADKTVQLRIFPDEAGRMNRSLVEAGGGAVSRLAIHFVWRLPERTPPGFR